MSLDLSLIKIPQYTSVAEFYGDTKVVNVLKFTFNINDVSENTLLI